MRTPWRTRTHELFLSSARAVTSLRGVTPPRTPAPPGRHPIGTPRALSANTGPIASAAWLVARELYPKDQKWSVEIVLGTAKTPQQPEPDEHATQLVIEIFAEEWGFRFYHEGRVSWIRITDVPFVHGRDDHVLLRQTPPLKDIGALVRELEQRYEIRFQRRHAAIRTSIDGSMSDIRTWLETL